MRTEIRLSGFGGQGVALIGFILGKALTLFTDSEAVMTQSYGPEARGGASSVNLVVSDEAIDYPFVLHPDILAALSEQAYAQFRHSAREDATILIEEDLVIPDEGDETYAIPATRLAEELGRRVVANMVMLGYIARVTGVCPPEAIEESIRTSVKPKTIELNIKAFNVGYNYPAVRKITGRKP